MFFTIPLNEASRPVCHSHVLACNLGKSHDGCMWFLPAQARPVGWGDFLAWDWVHAGVWDWKTITSCLGRTSRVTFEGLWVISVWGTGFYSVWGSKINHFRFEGFPTMFRRFPEGSRGVLGRGRSLGSFLVAWRIAWYSLRDGLHVLVIYHLLKKRRVSLYLRDRTYVKPFNYYADDDSPRSELKHGLIWMGSRPLVFCFQNCLFLDDIIVTSGLLCSSLVNGFICVYPMVAS